MYKSNDEIQSLFNKIGVNGDRIIIGYCGTGLTACINLFALALIGKEKNLRLYDGSWRPEYVFDALCASLKKKPKVCFTEGLQGEVTGFSGPVVFIIILVVIAINVIWFIVCKNFIRKKIYDRISSTDIDSKIDTVVNSYLALSDKP